MGAPIRLRSDTRLLLGAGTVLRAATNSAKVYQVILGVGVSRVVIHGGTIAGDRNEHTGKEGEWGAGIYLAASSDVLIEDVTSRDCWGDGLTVAANEPERSTFVGLSRRVTVRRSTFDHNRRNGISVVGVDHILHRVVHHLQHGGHAPAGRHRLRDEHPSYPQHRILGSSTSFMHDNVASMWFGGIGNYDVSVQRGRFHDAHGFTVGSVTKGLRVLGAEIDSLGGKSGFAFRVVSDDGRVDRLEVAHCTFTTDTVGVIVDVLAPGSHGRIHDNVITSVVSGTRALRVLPSSDFEVDHNVIRVTEAGGVDARSPDDWTHLFGAGMSGTTATGSSPPPPPLRHVFGIPASPDDDDEYAGGYKRGFAGRGYVGPQGIDSARPPQGG